MGKTQNFPDCKERKAQNIRMMRWISIPKQPLEYVGFSDLKDDILACVWNLRLVVIDLQYLKGFWFLVEDLIEDYIFAWWNIWIFIILLLPWDTCYYCKWQGHSVTHTTPLVMMAEWSLWWWVKKALEKFAHSDQLYY
jgi:hypothetical protein